MSELIANTKSDIKKVYLQDSKPWVIGYSGGKDSTVVARLVFEVLSELDHSQLNKKVYIVCSDTLVETPLVVNLFRNTLKKIGNAAKEKNLPIEPHAPVTPKFNDSFWSNLIGKGYPAPTKQFRWCTERMKIDPVNEFIKDKINHHGEVIIALGSRLQESASRAQVMKKHKVEDSLLSTHSNLPNAYVFPPIANWSADDVWEYLMGSQSPWGDDHKELFGLYKDSNAGECPIVIDKTTPSCGNSRFGCWTCTVVQKDKAMEGLIETGHNWMEPLKKFRNLLAETTEPENKSKYRSLIRRDGKLTVHIKEIKTRDNNESEAVRVYGPYTLSFRKELLRKLLNIQKDFSSIPEAKGLKLIQQDELEAIRHFWKEDPNEPDWEDNVRKIYDEILGDIFPIDWIKLDKLNSLIDEEKLKKMCEKYHLSHSMVKKLIEHEQQNSNMSKRAKSLEEISKILNKDWVVNEELINSKIDFKQQAVSRKNEIEELEEKIKILSANDF